MTSQTRPRARRTGRPRPGAWLLRIVRHRAWAQWRLLAVTAAVALVVATLVASLALVLDLSDRRGVSQALADDTGRAYVSVTMSDLDASVTEASDAVGAALVDAMGVPVATQIEATSELYGVPRADDPVDGLTWIDRRDGFEAGATLVEGAWPQAWSGDGPIPVAAPAGGAQMLDIALGDVVDLHDTIGDDDVQVRVDALYEVAYPSRAEWGRDRLGGAGYSPAYPVPGTAGFVMTEALGPLVASPTVLDSGAILVKRGVVTAVPDFDGVTSGQLARLDSVTANLEDEVGYRVDAQVGRVGLVAPVRFLLRDTETGVVVTRAGVAVAAVLLLLVAFAALLQTARLVADARNAEHDLMRARGASRAHLVAALVVETGALGVVVAAAGPMLAPLLLRAVGGSLAEGLPDGFLAAVAELPWTAWAAGVVVALMLVATTLVPLLGAPATFVEGQQARGRSPWAGSLARLAADAVVVAMAVGAWTQLRAYGGLLVGSGSGLTVDPVLVVGPALLLLAVVLVGVRVLTLVTRLADRGAARGRGVVLPLAGWELGRRPRQAATAVLLLAVSLAAATFGLTQTATWEQSQRDQAAFRVGAPAVVVDDGRPGTDAGTLIASGVQPQPVTRRTGYVGLAGAGAGGSFSGVPSDLLAATGPARATLDVGRLGTEGGADVAALATAAPTERGVDLGEDVLGLAATVTVEGEKLPTGPAVVLRAVLEDGVGALSTVELGLYPLVAGSTPIEVLLPEVRVPVAGTPQERADRLAVDAALRAYPVRLVGLQAVALHTDMAVWWGDSTVFDVQVSLDDVAVLRPAQDVSAVDAADWAQSPRFPGESTGIVRDPVEVPDEEWAVNGGLRRDPLVPADDPLWIHVAGIAEDLPSAPVTGSTVAWEPVMSVPAVISTAVAERLGPRVEEFGIEVEGVVVPATRAAVVDRIPTLTRDTAVAVDQTALARVVAQGASNVALLDEWWVDTPDAEAWAAGLPDDVAGRPVADRVTTLSGATEELLDHPLRAAIPLVLQLLALGGALVATVGFSVHTAVSVRGRGLELAQMRAVGLTRGRLTTVLGLEIAALAVLGVVLGLATGTGVAGQVTRLLVAGADGAAPVPDVRLVPAQGLGWVAVAVTVVVGVLATGIAAAQRAADPATLLRAGESR